MKPEFSYQTVIAAVLGTLLGCGNGGHGSESTSTPNAQGGSAAVATGTGGKGSNDGSTAANTLGGSGGQVTDQVASGGTIASGRTELGGSPSSGGQTSTGPASGGSTARGGQSSGGQSDSLAGGRNPAGGSATQGGLGGAAIGGARGGATTGGVTTGGAATGGTTPAAGGSSSGTKVIAFGTMLDPGAVMAASQALAKSLATPGSAQWRAKGDQKRLYHFSDANADVPYRLCVPNSWDGQSKLPLVMFLHGAGNNESSYLDQNNKQMVTLAAQHGVVLVSPLGYQGAYGTFIRLPTVFDKPDEAAKQLAAVTPADERNNELSEKDVINVLELVLNEYPIDRTAMFLTGHSMGSGGTWYLGAKYPDYWKALAPMSGPFVLKNGYPWDSLRSKSVYITEGSGSVTPVSSRELYSWMKSNGFQVEYQEVNADHGGMVPIVLPNVFDFFDKSRSAATQ